jgi:hypothetical protein
MAGSRIGDADILVSAATMLVLSFSVAYSEKPASAYKRDHPIYFYKILLQNNGS